MKTTQLCVLLLAGLCMGLAQPAFSQSITNTDNVITLTGTCLHTISGSYTLSVVYNYDGGTGDPINNVPVTVSDNGSTLTITGPSGSFPTINSTGFYSLADAITGTIILTNGPSGANAYLGWQKDFNGVMYPDCGLVPIYLSNLAGTLSGTTVHLTWNSYIEQNTTVMEIYRSTPGIAGYYKIGQVPAAGNHTGALAYSFIDNNPGSTNKYYIKMLNNQGSLPAFSDPITVGCAGCSYTQTPVNCTQYSITGPDYLCNVSTSTLYSLNTSLPNYNTITWSIDQPSVAILRTYSNMDPTKVTLLKTSSAAQVTLTAHLSGCSNPISKTIIVGAPLPEIYADQECPMVVCQPSFAPGATSYTWMLTNATRATQSYSSGYVFNGYIGDGSEYDVSLQYTNACGTSGWNTVGNFYCEPGQSQSTRRDSSRTVNPGNLTLPSGVLTWPNPTHGTFTVTLPSSKIYQIKVLDAQGISQKAYGYPGGVDKATVDIGNLASGVYIVQIFDKQRWVTKQVVLAK